MPKAILIQTFRSRFFDEQISQQLTIPWHRYLVQDGTSHRTTLRFQALGEASKKTANPSWLHLLDHFRLTGGGIS